MPEGDTVHQVAAALRPLLAGRALVAARVRRIPGLALAGRRVESVEARGKHLLVGLDDATVLRSHLGMYGAWHRYAPGERWRKPSRQAGIVLETGTDVIVCFNPMEVERLPAAGIRPSNLFNRLGPDLLAPPLDLDLVGRRAREFCEPEAPLADVLLDQRVACGIGNVYKSEVLFVERAHPLRALRDTPGTMLQALYATAAGLLERNRGGGRRVTRDADDGRGRLWVYGRAGRPCLRCGAPIHRERTGRDLRPTWWCLRCQPSG